MTGAVDTPVEPVQVACFKPALDCARAQAHGAELLPGNHPVLAGSQGGDCALAFDAPAPQLLLRAPLLGPWRAHPLSV